MTIRPALTSAGAAVLGCLLLAPAAVAAGGESTPLNLGGLILPVRQFGEAIDFLLAYPEHRAALAATDAIRAAFYEAAAVAGTPLAAYA